MTKQSLSTDDLLPVKTNKVWRETLRPAVRLLQHCLQTIDSDMNEQACECQTSCQGRARSVHQHCLRCGPLRHPRRLQAVKPRTGAATSIPGLLSIFHNVRFPSCYFLYPLANAVLGSPPGDVALTNAQKYAHTRLSTLARLLHLPVFQEWDALMLETHQLREALDARNKARGRACRPTRRAARYTLRDAPPPRTNAPETPLPPARPPERRSLRRPSTSTTPRAASSLGSRRSATRPARRSPPRRSAGSARRTALTRAGRSAPRAG